MKVQAPESRVRIECTVVPDPPVEDRFELHGMVIAPAAIHAVSSRQGREADLGSASRGADGFWRRSMRLVSYQADPGFPLVSVIVRTADGEQWCTVSVQPSDPSPFRPVLTSGLALPRRVCIVASGPTAAMTHRHIPHDFLILAVNKAVLLPGLRADVWMMNQLTSDSISYYRTASQAFHAGTRIFRLSTALATREEHAGRTDCHWFLAQQAPEQELHPDRDQPLGPCVRSGGTVTGCAIQVAVALGAREILLCGADMRGDRYFDGSRNDRDPKSGAWRHVRTLDRLIAHLCRDGTVTMTALGETALDVPRWNPMP